MIVSLLQYYFYVRYVMSVILITHIVIGVPGENHKQATGKLHHLRLRVECTLFVIYKAGREPTSY
jgi:hypothetical protein